MSDVVFARPDQAQLGSFHYPLGLIEFTLSEAARRLIERIRNGETIRASGELGENELTQLAYEVTSLIHEQRHFVDMFGTMAGLSLFICRMHLLGEFAALVDAMRSANMAWGFPIAKWAAAQDRPQEIRDFVRRARAFDVASDVFIEPLTPVEIDGHREDLSVEIDYAEGSKVDAFPLRMLRMGPDGNLRPRTVLYPLGIEALMEGAAHAVCRNYVGHNFPESVAKAFAQGVETGDATDEHGGTDQRAAQTARPYMVCDLLITRYLNGHGITSFPRELVLEMVDRALARSMIRIEEGAPGNTMGIVDRVGGKLVESLRSVDPKALADGELPDDPDLDKLYENLLATLEKSQGWQTVKDDLSLMSSLAIWEAYMGETFVVPLLRARVETKHRAFRRYADFIEVLPKIGLAPARVANGKLLLSTMPPRVQQAWWHHLMAGEIVRQLVNSKGTLVCPRAHSFIPGITTMNLALDGSQCERHLRLGCGTFRQGHDGITPKCLFEDALRVCALRRNPVAN